MDNLKNTRIIFGKSLTIIYIFLLASLFSCSARKGIPIGQIPVAETPNRQTQYATLSLIKTQAASSNQKVIKDDARQQKIQNMINRLAKAANAKGFSYPVLLVDAGEEVNAAAVNGSVIMVYSELLKRVPNDNELATVLGHEVGHILAKHHADNGAKEREEEVGIGSAIIGAIASVGTSIAGFGGSSDLAGDVASGVTEAVGKGAYVLAYDRDMEREADHIGLMLMAKAGYDPRYATGFWKRSEQIFGGGSGLAFFSTHPSSSDRLERLEAAMPLAMEYYQKKKKK